MILSHRTDPVSSVFLFEAAHIFVSFFFFNAEHILWQTEIIREKELTNLNP